MLVDYRKCHMSVTPLTHLKLLFIFKINLCFELKKINYKRVMKLLFSFFHGVLLTCITDYN